VNEADTGTATAKVPIAKIAIVSIAANFLCKFSYSPITLSYAHHFVTRKAPVELEYI
jgi:hypothetical protein